MYNFDNLVSVKKNTEKIEEKRINNYETAFNNALLALKDFKSKSSYDPQLLKKAADNLIEAMGQKRSKPEPYITLSCIFYMINEDKLAIKYLKVASELNPNLPQVNELRKLLGNISLTGPSKDDNSNELSKQSQQNEKVKNLEASSLKIKKIDSRNTNEPKRASPKGVFGFLKK